MAEDGSQKLDAVFHALAEQRRRIILQYLQSTNPASVEELRAQIILCESSQTQDEIDYAEYNLIESNLHHNHLPRLADLGLIEYDARSGDVQLDEFSPMLQQILSCTAEFENWTE